MTRQECEEKLKEKLMEIRGIIGEYDLETHLSLFVDQEHAWAFALREDQNGKAIKGDYLINVVCTQKEKAV